ncbi:hypothetical protein Q31b_39410 [Novipirellula aureliae]|uniref:Right handed beta helix domain-containing protein n=1 Tax=Novipirellula aureliae TaxID=2527966 RepID=A0A5C6DNJ5_9BACT|nr:right-handed parallel beta-helix repeat-containing protein [Novipirellula aureliae]TWU38863.1 hypothetical protein Q31b_39410 [Novipirellula aureliae]
MNQWATRFVAILFSALGVLQAAEIYVSPIGSDTNPGTKSQPVASLTAAQEKAREFAGEESVLVRVADGVYYLTETWQFSPIDSGTVRYPVVYRAENEGGAVLSGGSKLDLQWQPYRDGIFQAATPAGLEIDQLFLDGSLQHMARYPNHDPEIAVFNGYAADAFSPERAANWADPVGGIMHAIHGNRWGSYHYLIMGKKTDGSLTYEGGWQTGGSAMHPKYRFVENIREELDVPGEWYHDSKAGKIFFYPPAGVDLNQATVEIANLRSLVELRGTQETPVCFIRLSGFTFRHAKRTFMDTRERMLGSDWRIYRGGAVYFEGAEDCMLDHCILEQLGGNAVFVNNYNRRIRVQTCRIEDCGASAVCFVGSTAAVREPDRGRRQDGNRGAGGNARMDLLPGPLTEEYPSECTVENCLIKELGLVEKQVAGVEISMARRITVRDCSIYDVPRAGIDVGNGRWGGHLIEGCDVFNTVLETGDHGSFNSWGRDRLMSRGGGSAESDLAEIALLDNMEPTIIRNNRWRCDHGWDIDLDDGSSNYHIYNNLMLNGGLKFRQGFRRYGWNNVIINNALHPHVWYPNSGDCFIRNIVMTPYRPARMPEGKWGRELDYNLFTSNEADRDAFQQHGIDGHSVVGDAQFIDPAAGNFQVAEGSPALAIGFRNFPMDHFGVRDAKLRGIARTPMIPALRNVSSDPASIVYDWHGGKIRNIEGAEYSAWGISSEIGGVMVLYTPGWEGLLGDEGLREGDLINGCNGQRVKNVVDLIKLIQETPADQPLTIQTRRGKVVFPKCPPIPVKP